jgi:hypothetical protein
MTHVGQLAWVTFLSQAISQTLSGTCFHFSVKTTCCFSLQDLLYSLLHSHKEYGKSQAEMFPGLATSGLEASYADNGSHPEITSCVCVEKNLHPSIISCFHQKGGEE